MKLADYDYDLPPERIAQVPASPRDTSRLLVLARRASGAPIAHAVFRDLPRFLAPGDLIVLNDTRVIPARLRGTRAATGGKVECLLVRDRGGGRWEALLQSGGHLRPGEALALASGRLEARLVSKAEDGTWTIDLAPAPAVPTVLAEEGEVPLPPYIAGRGAATRCGPRETSGKGGAKPGGSRALEELDRVRYQTIYAREPGAVAAPTAGLHFTEDVFGALERRGVERAFLTLHVGPGTFRPIKSEDPRAHVMHAEPFAIPEATIAALEAARARGGRVIACGTTVARTLETYARTGARTGETALYIYPPFEWRLVAGLITNFHLPRSTLLLLVAAFAGRERVLDAYREAIALGYRFYSYGDAMLVV